MDKGFAEICGLYIGDGCLCEYPRKDSAVKRQVLLFTGNQKNDLQYYTDFVQPFFDKYYEYKGCLYKRKDSNVVTYSVLKKNVVKEFIDTGFKFGRKDETLSIPEEIFKDNKLALACIAGIFCSDGTVYSRYSKRYKNHSRKYNYAVIQIKLNAPIVIKQIKTILERNNIKCNRITGDNKKGVILRVTDQNSISTFFNKLNIKHKYHNMRYQSIKAGI